ncbi:MAG: hypothetical protein JXR97_12050 [Planctomycetes bacterium]|nr:hypothetical protein [Planctomycetota bacterium]
MNTAKFPLLLMAAMLLGLTVFSGCASSEISRAEIMKPDYKPKNMCDNCARRWERHEKSSQMKMCICDKCNELGMGCEKCRRKILKQTNECEVCGHLEH